MVKIPPQLTTISFIVVLIHRGGFLMNYTTCKLDIIIGGGEWGGTGLKLHQREPLLWDLEIGMIRDFSLSLGTWNCVMYLGVVGRHTSHCVI